MRATNSLLSKYGSDRGWVAMLLSAKKDAERFKTLHLQLERCVKHVTDMVALRQATQSKWGQGGGKYDQRMAEVADKVGCRLGSSSVDRAG